METTPQSTVINRQTTVNSGWSRQILTWLRLTNEPTVRIYRGFGNSEHWVVQGHVLGFGPLPRKRYRRTVWTNTFALLRLFLVRPLAGVTVRLSTDNADKNQSALSITTQTDADGFFRFEYRPAGGCTPGWQRVLVEVITTYDEQEQVMATGTGKVLVPHPTQYGFISDIDDTFLISHSATIFKRLLVLLTQNAYSRQPFAGVVAHYQFLANAGTVAGQPNPFFYVSSSEWNLYDYILTFSERNALPDGVYLLSQLKRLSQLWKTGRGNHHTKLDRIARILAAFPDQRFVLLGDDTQADPIIYEEVVRHYPGKIRAVYLRQVHAPHQDRTRMLVAQMEAAGVPVCYFASSAEALAHSQSVGLV